MTENPDALAVHVYAAPASDWSDFMRSVQFVRTALTENGLALASFERVLASAMKLANLNEELTEALEEARRTR